MKKIVFIIRDGYDAEYILNHVVFSAKYDIHIIKETGRVARKKKLRKIFSECKKREYIFKCIDLAALLLYDNFMTKKMEKILGFRGGEYCADICVNDVNENACIEEVRKIHPDLILIYGTGILKQKTIDVLGTDIYNIHSSILPYYRNVHSDFWAYLNHDYDKIGISIFKVNAGIDTGEIAFQKVNPLPKGSLLSKYKAENLRLIAETIPHFIESYMRGNIQLARQDKKEGSVGITPRIKDLRRLLHEISSF